ncbi:unnamed protein product [Ambrosiozyma monospora]|uniref:Unnamed protein product n=1 Tax=Ambrosiozyma monospora TaxID=43982 RepID=A0A9W6Z015_AMBMO|nr:unnamed protein product [Ambrosiozyma monospora]
MMHWISGGRHDANLIPVSFKFEFEKAIAACWVLGAERSRLRSQKSRVKSDHCVNYTCLYISLDSTPSLTVRFASCCNDNFYRSQAGPRGQVPGGLAHPIKIQD